MACARSAAILFTVLLAGCAASGAALRKEPDASFYEFQARLAARAASLVGHRGRFRVGKASFNPDCTGFIQAVYEAEGIPLRDMMQRAAPAARSGVAAAFRALETYGVVFGGGGQWPAPGDLVFWHDTYDRNRNGRVDDRFTHVGIVEYVVDGTVVFLHRGGKAVARGAMTPDRPAERSANGLVLNSPLRERSRRTPTLRSRAAVRTLANVPVLAGALFAGYGRIDPRRLPHSVELAAR